MIWQIGGNSGRYERPSGDLCRLWRWDQDERLCNEFDADQGRWVESINYEALFYFGQGYIMEPISTPTAQKAVLDLGWPKALTDRRYLSYDDIAALADETCEEPEPTKSNAVDLLIAESMPTLRPDVVRRLLGWPDPPGH